MLLLLWGQRSQLLEVRRQLLRLKVGMLGELLPKDQGLVLWGWRPQDQLTVDERRSLTRLLRDVRHSLR